MENAWMTFVMFLVMSILFALILMEGIHADNLKKLDEEGEEEYEAEDAPEEDRKPPP